MPKTLIATPDEVLVSESPVSGGISTPNSCPLVLVEWEDSAQPISQWLHLSSFDPPGTVRCASVGWLIQDDELVKAVAPNMGAINDPDNLQVSGVIQIPTRSVIKVTRLIEEDEAIA